MSHEQAKNIILKTEVMIPFHCDPDFVKLLFDLMNPNPDGRISSLTKLSNNPYFKSIEMKDVLRKQIKPVFVPKKDKLNCDPTYELEEMIIEDNPLHKKHKKLSRQMTRTEWKKQLGILEENRQKPARDQVILLLNCEFGENFFDGIVQ